MWVPLIWKLLGRGSWIIAELGVGATFLVLDLIDWSSGLITVMGGESSGVSDFISDMLILDVLTKSSSMKGVPDEQHLKTTGADEGTSTLPGVLDVPKYDSEYEKESWGDSGEEDDYDENDYEDESITTQ
ncbi:hypothetical protein Tco_1200651 [Tanacetum coccineum]